MQAFDHNRKVLIIHLLYKFDLFLILISFLFNTFKVSSSLKEKLTNFSSWLLQKNVRIVANGNLKWA